MRISFKKLYFNLIFICATLALLITVGVNVLRNEDVLSTSNIIISIAVVFGLIGSIILRKKEQKNTI